MTSDRLAAALTSVDWNHNVPALIDDEVASQMLAKANLRLAQWARQLENVDRNNPAMCFVREMQIASYHVAALTALALYKPAAGSMRTMLETALYYTYFRTHHSELATLVREPAFYVEKREIVDHHKKHTPEFGE